MNDIEFGSAEESARFYDYDKTDIDFSVLKGTKYKRLFLMRYERPQHLSRLQAGKRAVARMWGSGLGERLKLPAGF